MPMLLRHALIRARTVLTTPSGLVLLALAALGAPVVMAFPLNLMTLGVPGAWERPPPLLQLILLWLFGVYALWLWTWILARPFSRGRGTWGGRAWPLPALPIGFRGRLVAEAAAALFPVLLAGHLVVALLLAVSPLAARDSFSSMLVAFPVVLQIVSSHTVALGSLALPVVLAWLAPTREDGLYYARSFVVAVLAGLGPLWIPGPLLFRTVVSGLCLSALVVGSHDLKLALPFRKGAPSSESLSRPALEPEARFRRDRREQLRRPLLLYSVPAVLLLAAGPLSRSLTDLKVAFHPFFVLAAAGLLAEVYKRPVGIDLFATDRAARSPSLFSGAYARAWSALPLTPERVRRSVYLHGFLTALLVWLLFFGHTLFATALGLPWWPWHLDLPLALTVPCAAGLLLCGAVGDSARGTLSALALFSLPLAHFFSLVLGHETLDPTSATVLNVSVLLALAIVGGLPPLVHLRAAGDRRA